MQSASVNMGKKGVVLLIDDDELVLEVSGKMIQRLDYDVIEARDGQEAIALFKENSDRVDIIILDMRLPGMHGATVHDHLRKLKSDAKIILASGYFENSRVQDIIDHKRNDFIQKPFNFKQLAQKLDAMMAK
jgi:two-component system, cell cycle sensor histidine kinase and response regulator CckA